MNALEAHILPFLNKPKASAGVIIKERQPDQPDNDSDSSEPDLNSIEACIADFKSAMDAGDTKKAAEIVKNTHDLLHSFMDKGE